MCRKQRLNRLLIKADRGEGKDGQPVLWVLGYIVDDQETWRILKGLFGKDLVIGELIESRRLRPATIAHEADEISAITGVHLIRRVRVST